MIRDFGIFWLDALFRFTWSFHFIQMSKPFNQSTDESQLTAFKQFFEAKLNIPIEDLRQFCDSGRNLVLLIQLCVPNEPLALPKLFARGDRLKQEERESALQIAKDHEIFTPNETKCISPDDLDARTRKVSGLLVFLKAIARKLGFDFSINLPAEQPDKATKPGPIGPTPEQVQNIKALEAKLAQNTQAFENLLSGHQKLLKDMNNLLRFCENSSTADEMRDTHVSVLIASQKSFAMKMEEIVEVLSRVTQSNVDGTNALYQMIVADNEQLNTLPVTHQHERTFVLRVNDPSSIFAEIADTKAKLENRLNSYVTPFQEKIAALETKILQFRGSLAASEAPDEGQAKITESLYDIEHSLRQMQTRSEFASDRLPPLANCLDSLKSELENLKRQFNMVSQREREKSIVDECIRNLELKLGSRRRSESISAAELYKQSLLDLRNRTFSRAEHAKQHFLQLRALCDGTESCEIVPDHEFTELDSRVDAVMKRTDAYLPEIEEEISHLRKKESEEFERRFALAEANVGNLPVEPVQDESQLEELTETLENLVTQFQYLERQSSSLFDSTPIARYPERLGRMRDHLNDTYRAACQRLATIYRWNQRRTHRESSDSQMIVKVRFSSGEPKFFFLDRGIDVQSLKDKCCPSSYPQHLCRASCHGSILKNYGLASSFGVIDGATVKIEMVGV
jgi:hypothetical protein